MRTSAELVQNAWRAGLAVPAFNIPHLPMMEPIVRAIRDTGCFAFISVARLEWMKFRAGSVQHIRAEYERVKDERFTRLHLDHVPVIDEDNLRVDYLNTVNDALNLGYDSVMVDGSRLPLDQNIEASKAVVAMAHAKGVPCEAELGSVLGHEAGPLPPYEELYASGKGFTDPGEAQRFVRETGVDWLSVSIGNIHGAISAAARDAKKVAARLNIEHLDRIRQAAGAPLVLHGGSGIRKESVLAGMKHGIAKINVGTAIRQAYEAGAKQSTAAGQEAAYRAVVATIREELELADSASTINPSV